jgi:hypothetical protein
MNPLEEFIQDISTQALRLNTVAEHTRTERQEPAAVLVESVTVSEPPYVHPSVLFNQHPPLLSTGGVRIPNSSVTFKNPA